MKSKTTIALSTAAIAAVALLFAAGPVVGTQHALAFGWHGGGVGIMARAGTDTGGIHTGGGTDTGGK